MSIEIRGLGIHPRLRTHITRRMSGALSRRHIRPVGARVTFTDEDGPRGGVGVRCALTVRVPGRPTLRVEARSKSILLEHPPRSRQLAEVTDADVASAVASDYSLTANADTGVTRPFVVSDRVSDWDFLKSRADQLGWALYVRGDSLVMRPPASPSSPPRLPPNTPRSRRSTRTCTRIPSCSSWRCAPRASSRANCARRASR